MADAGGLVHPTLLTRLFLLLASLFIIVIAASGRRSGLLLALPALLPLAVLAWLAERYASSRTASWVVLALSVFIVGPVLLALLASLS